MNVSFTINHLVARSMLSLGRSVAAFMMLLFIFATMAVGKVGTKGWTLGMKLAFLKITYVSLLLYYRSGISAWIYTMD